VRLPRLTTATLLLAVLAAGQGVEQELNVHVRMRDGVRLSANVFVPRGERRVPAVLVRTPYGKGAGLPATYRLFADNGYAVVIQDVRGRGASEGEFRPLDQETRDGGDTIDWIAAQRWSDGQVAMVGGSYLGIVQWKAALSENPHLKAISPAVSGCDDYEDRFYSRGGALKLGHRLMWIADNLRAPGYPRQDFNDYVLHLPVETADRVAAGRTIEFFQTALEHPSYDDFWAAVSTCREIARVRAPVLSFGGWYDPFLPNDIEAFRRLRALGREARLVIGPWAHNMSSKFVGFDFGPEGDINVRRLQLEWFDRWLKHKPPAREGPPLRYFQMGENRWRDEVRWPPDGARETEWYLGGDHANGPAAAGTLTPSMPGDFRADRFVYDPAKPVPTMGGAVCCNASVFPWGPVDQRPVERRPDVLVYTTQPLEHELAVTGAVRAVLYVSVSTEDADFTAKLADVYPDGRAINVADGILRLRYRESASQPKPVRRGQVYRISVYVGDTAHTFRRGHRIRLEISGGNFPRFDRNPNAFVPVAGAVRLRRSTQTVYRDRSRPSLLVLPAQG
jgi:putative CocE/NonD family hydrolase